MSKKKKDITFIDVVKNWNSYINSSYPLEMFYPEVIELLYDKIEFTSSASLNGEYGSLFAGWRHMRPIFHLLMSADTEQEVVSMFRSDGNIGEQKKLITLFHEIQLIKKM